MLHFYLRNSTAIKKAIRTSLNVVYFTSFTIPTFRTKENKAYELDIGSQNILAYCHMNDTGLGTCGGGGWTLVMKIDGTQV